MQLRYKKLIARNTKHGFCGTKIYIIWRGMIERCSNKNQKSYKDYGGRGITVCKNWSNFINFYKDMGNPPTSKHSIDRVDNNKGYFKENCKWATRIEQNRNSRHCHQLTYKGKTKPISVWAEYFNIPYFTFQSRLKRNNWNINKINLKP